MTHHPSRALLLALAWMLGPFVVGFGLMMLIAHAPTRLQQAIFFLVLLTCLVGQAVALSRLADDNVWPLGWRLLGMVVKVVAFVCLLSFAGMTAIAGYYLIFPGSPRLFDGH